MPWLLRSVVAREGNARSCWLLQDEEYTLKLEKALLKATHEDKGSSLDELRKAISMCEDGCRRARRVYGDSHPITAELARELDLAREELAERTQS